MKADQPNLLMDALFSGQGLVHVVMKDEPAATATGQKPASTLNQTSSVSTVSFIHVSVGDHHLEGAEKNGAKEVETYS